MTTMIEVMIVQVQRYKDFKYAQQKIKTFFGKTHMSEIQDYKWHMMFPKL